MQTAVKPKNANESLNFEFDIGNYPNTNFYIYMHFAEVEIPRNQFRGFNIALNGKVLEEVVVLKYLRSTTIATRQPMRGAKLTISINKLPNSTLPPILNAMEIYILNEFWQQPTDQEDGMIFKKIYN